MNQLEVNNICARPSRKTYLLWCEDRNDYHRGKELVAVITGSCADDGEVGSWFTLVSDYGDMISKQQWDWSFKDYNNFVLHLITNHGFERMEYEEV